MYLKLSSSGFSPLEMSGHDILVSYQCREHDKKVCCLGLTALLALPADQLPAEALGRVFKATLDLLVAYKDQVAGYNLFLALLSLTACRFCVVILFIWTEAAKEEEAEDDDDMDGFQTDDEDDGDGSDKEMGDTEDGDEADSVRLKQLAAQVYTFLFFCLKFSTD